MHARSAFIASLALAATPLLALPTAAQNADWPVKSVRVVVPNNPGSGSDLGARILADAWTKAFGQPFVVENVPGAANTVGAAEVASSPPDGYTFLHCSLSSIVLVPLMRTDITYKVDDFAPVGQSMSASNTVLVNPDKIPVDTFAELIEELKKKPGEYNYSSSGVGGLSHLLHELMMLRTGTEIQHIPYGGASEATAALLAGEVDLGIISTTPALPYIESGDLKALAVAQAERIPELPDIPAIGEIVPEYEGVENWNGVFAPAGTPPEIIEKLNAATVAFLATAEGKEAMARIGAGAASSSPDEFKAHIERDIATWQEVIGAAGLAPK